MILLPLHPASLTHKNPQMQNNSWHLVFFFFFVNFSPALYYLNAWNRLHCSGSFSHHVKFYSFIFMHKISTRVICVNGKHPLVYWLVLNRFLADKWEIMIPFPCTGTSEIPISLSGYTWTDRLPLNPDARNSWVPGRTIIPFQHLGNCGHLSYNYVKTCSFTYTPKKEHKV